MNTDAEVEQHPYPGLDGTLGDIMAHVVEEQFGVLNNPMAFNPWQKPLNIVKPNGVFRMKMVRTVDSKMFNYLILVFIVLNTIMLALDDPELDHIDWLQKMVTVADFCFLIIFVVEIVMKVLAMGFFVGRKAFLKSGWNALDFVVVLCHGISILFNFNIRSGVIRLARLLRALRTIIRVRGFKVIVATFTEALTAVFSSLAVLTFFIWVFAAIGLLFFAGQHHQRCYALWPNGTTSLIHNDTLLCSVTGEGRGCTFGSNGYTGSQKCHVDTDQYEAWPFTYDNIGLAILSTFKIITLDGWNQELQRMMYINGWWVWVYYIPVILVGQYFCVNMLLAVMASIYDREERSTKTMRPQNRQVTKITHLALSYSVPVMAIALSNIPKSAEDDGNGDTAEPEDDFSAMWMLGDATVFQQSEDQLMQSIRPRQHHTGNWKDRFLKHMAVAQSRLRVIVTSRPFEYVFNLLILFNVVVLSLDHYGASAELLRFIDTTNFVISILFVVECVAKILGLGLRGYFFDGFNVFDFIMILISIPDFVSNEGGDILVLRAFRFVRLVRLARRFPVFVLVAKGVLKAVEAGLFICLLLLLFLFISALVGLNFFRDPPSDRRVLFTNLPSSLVTTFVIVTGDGWSDMMRSTMTDYGGFTAIYFIAIYILGKWLIILMFVAALISFMVRGQQESREEIEQREILRFEKRKHILRIARRPQHNRIRLQGLSTEESPAFNERQVSLVPDESTSSFDSRRRAVIQRETNTVWFEDEDDSDNASSDEHEMKETSGTDLGETKRRPFLEAQHEIVSLSPSRGALGQSVRANQQDALATSGAVGGITQAERARKVEKSNILSMSKELGQGGIEQTTLEFENSTAETTCSAVVDDILRRFQQVDVQPVMYGMSCFIFAVDHPVRRFSRKVVLSPHFNLGIYVAVILNVLLTAIHNERITGGDANDSAKLAFLIIDCFFATLFAVEMIAKIIAYGLIGNPRAYLRSVWNCIDGFVAIFYIVGLAVLHEVLGVRSLRIVRLATKVDDLRTIITSVFVSVPALFGVLVVIVIIWWIFAVLGVGLFKGRYSVCTNPAILPKADCYGFFNATIATAFDVTNVTLAAEWRQIGEFSFNDAFEGLAALFKVAVGNNWSQAMFTAMDNAGFDMGQRRNANGWRGAFFFIGFVIVGQFFTVNIFIGVLIRNFKRQTEKITGAAYLSPGQRQWVIVQHVLLKSRLLRPINTEPGTIRHRIYTFVRSPGFDYFMMLVIILNGIVISLTHHDMSDSFRQALRYTSIAFLVIYIIEAALKLYGYGPVGYFARNWNRFDFLVLVVSIVGVAMDGQSASAFRIFRILRIIRLLRGRNLVAQLFEVLFQSMPSLLNIGLILLMVIMIFSFFGVDLFRGVEVNVVPDGISSDLHFDNVMRGFVTLSTVATGQGWVAMKDSAGLSPPQCIGNSCGSKANHFFFYFFVICVTFVLLNLFVTVLLENFDNSAISRRLAQRYDVFANLKRQWLDVDREATAFLPAGQVVLLLRSLGAPFWIHGTKSRTKLFLGTLPQLQQLYLPLNANQDCSYFSLLSAVSTKVFNITLFDAYQASEVASFMTSYGVSTFCLHHWYAAQRIQSIWRGRKYGTKNLDDALRKAIRTFAADRNIERQQTKFNDYSFPIDPYADVDDHHDDMPVEGAEGENPLAHLSPTARSSIRRSPVRHGSTTATAKPYGRTVSFAATAASSSKRGSAASNTQDSSTVRSGAPMSRTLASRQQSSAPYGEASQIRPRQRHVEVVSEREPIYSPAVSPHDDVFASDSSDVSIASIQSLEE